MCVCFLCTPPASGQPANEPAPPDPAAPGTPSRDPAEQPEPPDANNENDGASPNKPPDDEPGAPPDEANAEPDDEPVTPPKAVVHPPAEYPRGAPPARVILFVTVQADGSVGDVAVAESGGTAFDEAAVRAVRQWRFEPARRGTEPVAARIRIPMRFAAPEAPKVRPTRAPTQTPENQPPKKPTRDGKKPIEVTVVGDHEKREEQRSASDFEVERDIILAAPRHEGAEALRTAPGLYIGRAAGAAVGHRYMLRGFDADHGQDIEFRVGGLPINQPAHIHGQGYTDLGFLISDVISTLHVSEGVYDPKQGDFAVAGSIDIELGVPERDRGLRVQSGWGRFDTFRQLVRWAPRAAPEETFGAVQYFRTDGFGENRAATGASGIVQNRFGSGDLTFRTIGVVHSTRSDSAGVLRKDDIDAGTVCFTCVYSLPTATQQNGFTNRVMAGIFADHQRDDGANGQAGFWLGHDTFRVQQNFTGFIERSRTLPGVSGRGDLIEQQHRALSFGLTGRHRTAQYRPTSWAHGTAEVGVDARVDLISQQQNLLDGAVRNQTWDNRVDAAVRAMDIGFWGDLDWGFTKHVHTRLGFRADLLSYEIDDRLGNFAPLTRPQDSFIQGFRRSAQGLAWGPRASVEVLPVWWLTFLAAYGEGFRSPQARTLEDGESAPFAKVRSADVGVRVDIDERLKLTVAGYHTLLSDDVAFEAREGSLERIGETRRLGGVFHVSSRPVDWLVGAFSATLVRATLEEPPPPTAEEPQPPFEDGQALPFVPPVVLRADIGANRTLIDDLGGQSFGARTGIGFSYLSPRPLPFDESAAPVRLVDASAGLVWGFLDLSFEVFNLLNSRYSGAEFNHASDWNPNDGFRSRVPARHIAAGAPLSWMVSLGATL